MRNVALGIGDYAEIHLPKIEEGSEQILKIERVADENEKKAFVIGVPSSYEYRLRSAGGRLKVKEVASPGCVPALRNCLEKGMILEVGVVLDDPNLPRVVVVFNEFSSSGRAWVEINCPTSWPVYGPASPQRQAAAAPS